MVCVLRVGHTFFFCAKQRVSRMAVSLVPSARLNRMLNFFFFFFV
jgi:hypothetical protein